MKQLTLFKFTACVAFFFATGYNPSNGDKTADTNSDSSHSRTKKADPATPKAEIQERERYKPDPWI